MKNEKGEMIKMTMDDVWGIAMVVVMAVVVDFDVALSVSYS